MKSRNPVAGNAHRYNKAYIIPNKKRESKEHEEDWLPEDEEEEDEQRT